MKLGDSHPALAGSRMRAGRIGLAALAACMSLGLTAGASDAFATYGKITIKKVNLSGPAGDTFGFSASPHLGGKDFALAGGGSWSKTVLANAAPYHTDKVFTVNEAYHAGYELKSLECKRVSAHGSPVDGDSATSLAERKATIKVSPNEHVECTFTNARKATLIVKKTVAPAHAESPKPAFAFTGTDAAFSLSDGGSHALSVSPDKPYTVAESDPAAKGYKLDAVGCTRRYGDGEKAIEGAGDVAARKATVTPAAGDVITCVFTNAKLPAPPPKPPSPPAPPAPPIPPAPPAPPAATPAQAVAGTAATRPARGSARMRGPGACPSGRVASATVTGRRIARVTFLVDGRAARTLTKPDARARWVLPVRLSSLRAGAHRVEARVQFTRASGTRTRTLRVTVTKCAAREVAPRFTG